MSRLEMVGRTSENFLHTAANTLNTVSADLSFDQQKLILTVGGLLAVGGAMFWVLRRMWKNIRAPKWPHRQ